MLRFAGVALLLLPLFLLGCTQYYPLRCPAETEPRFYVIGHWGYSEPDELDRLPGLDLDGRPGIAATDRCDDAIDFVSPRTGERSVDNQFGANVAGLIAGLVPDPLGTMTNPAALRGIELCVPAGGTVADVRSAVWLHVSTEGPLPAGSLLPGGVYRSRGRRAGFGLEPRGTDLAGAIATGVSLPILSDFAPLTLNGARVRFARDGAEGVLPGEIGGGLVIEGLVGSVVMLSSFPFDEAWVRAIAMPDLEPNGDASVCNAVSIGATIELTPGTLIE